MKEKAASHSGWSQYVRSKQSIIAMDSFDPSAPAENLCEKFGIAKQAIINRANALI